MTLIYFAQPFKLLIGTVCVIAAVKVEGCLYSVVVKKRGKPLVIRVPVIIAEGDNPFFAAGVYVILYLCLMLLSAHITLCACEIMY